MTVPGYGPPNAKIALVGEAPGVDEEHQGKPFVGASGHLLTEMLSHVGIPRTDCYLTNVIKERPPKNDFSKFYLDKSRKQPSPKLTGSILELQSELGNINPNITVALGNEALKALASRSGIDRWRGSILATDVGKLVPTYHPAYVLRNYSGRPIVELDLKRALEESQSPALDLPHFDFELKPSLERVLQFLNDPPPSPIAFDIETTGNHVRCLGFAWSASQALVIPFHQAIKSTKIGATETPTEPSWTLPEEKAILDGIQSLFLERDLIAQNFPFDSTILARDFGLRTGVLRCDTLLLHHALYPELPKSLDFLASVYTRVPRYSDYNAENDESTWLYNAKDCAVTWEVARQLETEAREAGVWAFYKGTVEPAMFSLTRAQNRGVSVDAKEREFQRAALEQTLREKEELLLSLTGRQLNPQSPKQMKEYFYDELHLPPVISRSTHNPTVDDAAIVQLKGKFPKHKPTFSAIQSHRTARTILSTFLDDARLDRRGRFTTAYNIGGTKNGRLSSSKTLFGVGGNLQNIPKSDFRRMFLPEDGHIFIKADLSQAEVRVVAWIAPIPLLIKRFSSDKTFDIHTWNATNIFGGTERSITKEQRGIAKAGVHGGNYGLGARKAAQIYQLGYQDAKRAIEAYRSALPEVKEWWGNVQSEVSSSRTLTSPLGRRRVFMGRLDDETFRSAYSFIPQATVSDIISRAFFRVEALVPGVLPILQVHDEVCFSCPKELLEEALPKIKRLLEPPIKIPGQFQPLVIPCDIEVGRNWWDVEERIVK